VRRTLALAALLLTLVLAGCTGDPETDALPAPTRTRTPESTPADPAERPYLRPIPARLRVALPSSADVVDGGIVLDLADAVEAPSVDEAPVAAGMLLAQLGLFSTDDGYETIGPGQPFLMTRWGEWRRLDLGRYGFGATVYGELSMAISADGRHLAFSDPSALVAVDLRDNTFERFELPVDEAITLEWSPDASSLLLKDRHPDGRPCGPKGCRLDLDTGRLTAVPFDLFHSAHGADGEVVELRTTSPRRSGVVLTHRDGRAPTRSVLQYLTSAGTAGGPAVARYVAFARCGRRVGKPDSGVVVADPASGSVVSMLTSAQRPTCRLGARSWLSDQHLVVDDWRTGDLWLWDVAHQRVVQLADGRTSGINVSVAADVMSNRFGQLLRP
jgi:hypothetical protein